METRIVARHRLPKSLQLLAMVLLTQCSRAWCARRMENGTSISEAALDSPQANWAPSSMMEATLLWAGATRSTTG